MRQGRNDEYALACGGRGGEPVVGRPLEEVLQPDAALALENAGPLKPMSRVLVEVLTGLALFSLGRLAEARVATEEALRELEAMPAHERLDITGVDPRVLTLTQSVSISVHQGLLERADADTRRAVDIAEARDHALALLGDVAGALMASRRATWRRHPALRRSCSSWPSAWVSARASDPAAS